MTPEQYFNLFNMSQEEYLDLFPVMNVDVRTQDGGDTAIIDIDGYIGRDIIREWITGEKSPNTIENIKQTLREISAKKIITNINSYGGDLNAGIVIKDMLQSKNAEVITNIQGFCASAATVISQAGSTRRASDTSFVLVHRAMVGMMGYYNQNSLRALTKDQEVIDNAMITMYAKQANIEEDEIADLMDEGEGYGRWMDAEETLEKGFIDEVYDPADEDDPNTDHLETEDEEESNSMFSNSELKKALAIYSTAGIEDAFEENPGKEELNNADEITAEQIAEIYDVPVSLLNQMKNFTEEQESEKEEITTAEEARSERSIENEILIKENEV